MYRGYKEFWLSMPILYVGVSPRPDERIADINRYIRTKELFEQNGKL